MGITLMSQNVICYENSIGAVMQISINENSQPDQVELYKERLGDVKNQLLESVKQRWIRPGGRRDSFCSVTSGSSKRDRDEVISDRSNQQRTSSPFNF